MTRPLSEAERWCELPPEERPQLPVTDPLAQQVFLQFAPLMKRVLLRDPYATMSVSLFGFERDCVEEGTPTYEMRLLLVVIPSGSSEAKVGTPEPLLGPDAPDSELDALFTAYPPQRGLWPRSAAMAPHYPRTTPETPVDPVPPLACIECGQPADYQLDNCWFCEDCGDEASK